MGHASSRGLFADLAVLSYPPAHWTQSPGLNKGQALTLLLSEGAPSPDRVALTQQAPRPEIEARG